MFDFPTHENPLGVLKDMRELLSDEKRWTKGTYAIDKDDAPVPSYHPEAVSFCTIGALRRVTNFNDAYMGGELTLRTSVRDMIMEKIPKNMSIYGWNDASTHQEVIDLLDSLIRQEEAKL